MFVLKSLTHDAIPAAMEKAKHYRLLNEPEQAESICEDVLRLEQGAVVALDKLAGDPVDVYANGRLIARGEVLVLNDNFCVRVAELITGEAAS